MALESTQEPHSRDSTVVRARGALWHVVGTTPGADCRALHVRALGTLRGEGTARTFIEPFERCRPVTVASAPRRGLRAAWMRALRELAASATRVDVPRGVAAARIDLLAYQLEPAIAFRRGEATRVLVADHVGLGKTVQAGIVVADLLARREAAHVLIVTPAGLRDQWHRELDRRFGIDAVVCDAAWVAAEAARWPPGVNPWSPPAVRLVSSDYLKRPEVLNALEAVTWDLLVIDEAHAASSGSDRGAAIDATARRSRRVLCTTATPHDGTGGSFAALCRLGRHGAADRLAVFRRSRAVVGRAPGRRSVTLRVRGSAAERRMHELLEGYASAADRVAAPDPGAGLALTVLLKRALSSARAVELTAFRRRVLLVEDTGPSQGVLPFPEDPQPPDGEVASALISRPALRDARHERAWLGALVETARRAARAESKVAALVRLLRRARQPHIVFTEYRDTQALLLRALRHERVAVLHGGQTDDERRQALSEFSGGVARILLATDTASEGLNLHERCRSVVSFDVPWTPVRAEQRVGRVDRLGQSRRVHATSLVVAGTADEWLLRRLAAGTETIRRALGDEGSPSTALERLADRGAGRALALDTCDGRDATTPWQRPEDRHETAPGNDVHGGGGPPGDPVARDDPEWRKLSLGQAAAEAREWIDLVRVLVSGRRTRTTTGCTHRPDHPGRCRPACVRPQFLASALRVPQRLGHLDHGLLLVARAEIVSASGHLLETHVVPMVCELERRIGRGDVTALLTRHAALVRRTIERALAARVAQVGAISARYAECQRERERAIAHDRERRLAHALIQPGLFDGAPGRKVTPPAPRVEPAVATTPVGDTPRDPVPAVCTSVVLAAVFRVRPRALGIQPSCLPQPRTRALR